MTPRQALIRTHARTLAAGSSFIALGVAIGVVLSRSDAAARALACAALVVEIGSAVVVMRRGLRAVAKIEREQTAQPPQPPADNWRICRWCGTRYHRGIAHERRCRSTRKDGES